jgi:excisionase family DNA binding protein
MAHYGTRPDSPTHYEPPGSALDSPAARHTMHPPVSCLGRPSPAPPGGRFWHGFAVRRPPVGGGGWGLTFSRVAGHPMQATAGPHIEGMARKPTPTFFTDRSLAAYLAVSDRTVRNWIRRGELPSYKLGASRRIDPSDVETFLSRHRDEAA